MKLGRAVDPKRTARPVPFTEFARTVLLNWDRVVALDLLEAYGTDVYEPATADKPWWLLYSQIMGLLDRPSRLSNLINRKREGG